MRNVSTLTGLIIFFTIAISSCKTIYPGEVGFVIHKGMIKPGILTQGRYHYNFFTSKICKFNTRIEEFSTTMSPPTKEGLEVKVDLTVLYHIKPEAAPTIYTNVGMEYGKKIVVNNFMAIVREYTMKYTAIELLNERETIEKNIEDKLRADISTYGIILDDVLVKDIDMPAEVLHAIENKAKAEQIAKQTKLELQTKRDQEDFEIETKEKELNFAIEKQRNDSLLMQIDANAIKNYQITINTSLTDKILKFKSIEITKELVKSANAKIIILDGKTMMLNNVIDK
jgi:prohibitin 1